MKNKRLGSIETCAMCGKQFKLVGSSPFQGRLNEQKTGLKWIKWFCSKQHLNLYNEAEALQRAVIMRKKA